MSGRLDWQALGLSIRLASLTASILLVLGIPLAYWLGRTKKRWKSIVEALVALPLLLPPTVLGFYILWATGSRSPLGRFLERLTGSSIPFSFKGLVLGSILYSLPFAIQPMANAFSSIDQRLIEAARLLGDRPFETFFRTAIPLSYRAILTGGILSFAHTIGEFGIVLMIGGNIPNKTRTISIAIYDAAQALDYASASTTAALLLGFSFAILVTVYTLSTSSRVPWPRA